MKEPKKVEPKKSVSEGYNRFSKALKKPDEEITIILFVHMLSEYYLEQAIVNSLKRGDLILEKGNFRFGSKLLIVRALDFIPDHIVTALKHLNTVRNNCAHQMDYKVTEATVDLIGQPFGKKYSDLKAESKDLKDRLINVLILIMSAVDFFCEPKKEKK